MLPKMMSKSMRYIRLIFGWGMSNECDDRIFIDSIDFVCDIICWFDRNLFLLISGNSLYTNNGQRFSTKDSDNDQDSSLNCAAVHLGAWWYKDCSASNLNGLYLRGSNSPNGSFNVWEGIMWYHLRGHYYSLKTSEMKISSY